MRAITCKHASHFVNRPKKSLSLSPGRSNLSSLTIFLQSVSCCKSTAVTPNGGGALRSGTVGLRSAYWSRGMLHTGLCISPLQRSLRRPRLGILLRVVKAWRKVHWVIQHVCFISNSANIFRHQWPTFFWIIFDLESKLLVEPLQGY